MSFASFNRWEVAVAGLFVLLGAYIVWQASFYPIGTLTRMGPGFFPIIIGVALIVLGVALMAEVARSEAPPPELPVRAIGFVAAGLTGFAIMVDRVGLVPATLVLVVLALLADERPSWKLIAGVSAGLMAIGYFIFHLAFRIPFEPFRWG